MATIPGAVGEAFWQSRVYEPFMMRLFQKLDAGKMPADLQGRDLGPYADLFRHWHDAAALSGALSKICDYHCENMIDKRGDEEFDLPPFDLYPVEILAVTRCAKRPLGWRLGQSTIRCCQRRWPRCLSGKPPRSTIRSFSALSRSIESSLARQAEFRLLNGFDIRLSSGVMAAGRRAFLGSEPSSGQRFTIPFLTASII